MISEKNLLKKKLMKILKKVTKIILKKMKKNIAKIIILQKIIKIMILTYSIILI